MSNLKLYHQVETVLWLEIRALLRQIAVARIGQATDILSFKVPRSSVEMILNFCNQMELAHLHPNSSGIKFKLEISNSQIIEKKLLKISQQSKSYC